MIKPVVLQACGMEPWLAGDWGQCIWTPVTGLVGEGVFGLLIGVAVYVGLYFAGGGNSTTATVVTILLATVLFPTLPPAYRGIAWTVLFVGGAAAIFQGAQKYILSAPTMR